MLVSVSVYKVCIAGEAYNHVWKMIMKRRQGNNLSFRPVIWESTLSFSKISVFNIIRKKKTGQYPKICHSLLNEFSNQLLFNKLLPNDGSTFSHIWLEQALSFLYELMGISKSKHHSQLSMPQLVTILELIHHTRDENIVKTLHQPSQIKVFTQILLYVHIIIHINSLFETVDSNW